MADVGVYADHLQHPPTTDAEDDLLFQPQLAVTAVELAGNAAVRRCVRRVVRVHQRQPHAANLNLPDANPHGRAGKRNCEPHPFPVPIADWTDRKLAGIVEWIKRLLATVDTYVLPKISLLIEQTDSDDWNHEIISRFQEIARDISQTA